MSGGGDRSPGKGGGAPQHRWSAPTATTELANAEDLAPDPGKTDSRAWLYCPQRRRLSRDRECRRNGKIRGKGQEVQFWVCKETVTVVPRSHMWLQIRLREAHLRLPSIRVKPQEWTRLPRQSSLQLCSSPKTRWLATSSVTFSRWDSLRVEPWASCSLLGSQLLPLLGQNGHAITGCCRALGRSHPPLVL